MSPLLIATAADFLGPLVDEFQGEGPWSIETLNSTYHVRRTDDHAWEVTRITGRNAPTPRTGEDGVWKRAARVEIRQRGMWILWHGYQGTATSKIRSVSPLV